MYVQYICISVFLYVCVDAYVVYILSTYIAFFDIPIIIFTPYMKRSLLICTICKDPTFTQPKRLNSFITIFGTLRYTLQIVQKVHY